jgi:hypothetical protein
MDKNEQEAEIFPMGAVLNKLRGHVNTSRKGCKARHLTVSGAIDRRSLRATGRTVQMNQSHERDQGGTRQARRAREDELVVQGSHSGEAEAAGGRD